MNNLKDRYFFLVDFFLPEKNNLILNEFNIIEPDHIDLLEYIIYPIRFQGFFQDSLYIFLKREDYIYKDKTIILDRIKEYLNKGIKNLYALNFKKINLTIESYLDEIQIDKPVLVLHYTETENDSLSFDLIFTESFLYSFTKGLLSNYNEKKNKNINELLSYLRLRLYRDSITSFWDMKNFIRSLNSKDIQKLINLLLRYNIVEETMLTGFIAGFSDSKLQAKFLSNLSKNLREDVEKNLIPYISDIRWIEESSYLIRFGIEKLIFNNQLTLEQLHYIQQIKERIKQDRYDKIFQERSFNDYLKDAYKREIIDDLVLKTGRKLLLISLKNSTKDILNYFTDRLSKKAKEEWYEDLNYYQNLATNEDVFKAKIEVLDILKRLIYSKEAEDIYVFTSIISNLSSLNLHLLIEEVGLLKFVQATFEEDGKIKKYIVGSLKGIMRNIIVDLYNGRVRFKVNFGDEAVKRNKQEVLKTYYFLKDNGKFL